MNKSLEYIKKRIVEGSCNNITIEEFSNMSWLSSKFAIKSDTETDIIATTQDGDIIADLKYNPDAEFNYFTTETCVCDGTLAFVKELIDKIMYKIRTLNTYYAPMFENIPEDKLDEYKMSYEIGDFVINSYIIEPPDKTKLWLCDKFTVMLPIKFTIEKVR